MLKKYWLELFIVLLIILNMLGMVTVWKPVFYGLVGIMVVAMLIKWMRRK